MKNLDVTVSQIILLAIGGFYVYAAIGLFKYNLRSGNQSSFVFMVFIGIVLLGLALALQEVRRFRAKKSFLNSFLKSGTNAGEKNSRLPAILAICPECKNRIPSESKYCPECGTDLQHHTP
jgi:uncharacterized paraquat-inducible protein A